MKQTILLYFLLALVVINNDVYSAPWQDGVSKGAANQPLPAVFSGGNADLLNSKLRKEAAYKFALHQLPETKEKWEEYRTQLKDRIITITGALTDQELPLDTKVTRTIDMEGYKIENIAFQTRPGVYATANLFIPDGEGPFPAAIVMMGHSTNGRLSDTYQTISHILALNGYVSLSIDPWGAGERTTTHGTFEYHGANLGASLMNIGESLMGVQITDNMRGVDLLASLPYVDPQKIGATGTSGGGNQTMWLAAMDSRIKAAVPVTSVGTFESYIMESNCICESLVDGLTFTEEAGVLALTAPNALALYSGLKEGNSAFYPSEMLRSYNNAKHVFELYGVGENLNNKVLDLPHGYSPEMRHNMIGWFNLHLKGEGTGEPVPDVPFELVSEDDLMTFPRGKRDNQNVYSTETFCKSRGDELRAEFLNKSRFNTSQKKEELRKILRINAGSKFKEAHKYAVVDGWERYALETSDKKLIPLLHKAPRNNTGEYVILADPEGKNNISAELIKGLERQGKGLILVDLEGTGEITPSVPHSIDKRNKFHTLSRAELWLGRTLLGEWVNELDMVSAFAASEFNARNVTIDGSKEFGLAALFLAALDEGKADKVVVRNAPLSYQFDTAENIDYFSMGIHLPGILKWGDISLAAGLSGKEVEFRNPVTMSGHAVDEEQMKSYRVEFEKMRAACDQGGQTTFVKSPVQL